MLQPVSKSVSERILVCAPFGRDAELIERELRRAGLLSFPCSSLKNLSRCIKDGAGAALICDHAFGHNDVPLLAETLSNQPPWSELPVLIMTSGGSTTLESRAVLRELQPLGKLTLLERPLRPDTLVSTIRTAVRARRRQYQIRDYISRLEEGENTLRTYLNNTGDGIYVADQQTGRILDINQRAVERLGYSRDELLRLSLPDLFVEGGPIAAALRDFSCSKLSGVSQLEGTKRRKSGSTFPVEIHLASLAPALPDQVLAVMRDISARKKVDQEREEEARRKDNFLALLGHELRNPLAVISTALEVISGNCTQAQREELQQAAAQQVTLMQRLLDDLLDLSRIVRGRSKLEKESINLSEFMVKAAEAVQSTIAERRQDLSLNLPPRPVKFMADRARLTQITTNLLSNASKYTGPGGRIELSGAREDSEVVLRCKDNGQGILAECTHTIFEPFTRGRNARDSYGEASLGIGLSLVKQLVELHGGKVSAKSGGAGSGSEFTVRLPLITPRPRDLKISGPQSVPATQGARSVVIVEDNPMITTSMKIALERAGHRVRSFMDAPGALAGIARLRPDVLILDVGLPGMNGYELATKLKGKKSMGNALFIAVSGFERRPRTKKESDPFDHYFVKPVEVPTLLDLLARHPRAEAKRKPGEKRQKPQKSKRPGRLRVLLVEDHPFAADAMASLLRMEGLEVRTALTGREALEAAPDFRPQLVLCDMRLGDMNGLDVIRELRSNPSTRRAHAIILTGFSGSEIREFSRRAKDFGVDEFISKPIETAQIRRLVDKVKSH